MSTFYLPWCERSIECWYVTLHGCVPRIHKLPLTYLHRIDAPVSGWRMLHGCRWLNDDSPASGAGILTPLPNQQPWPIATVDRDCSRHIANGLAKDAQGW